MRTGKTQSGNRDITVRLLRRSMFRVYDEGVHVGCRVILYTNFQLERIRKIGDMSH